MLRFTRILFNTPDDTGAAAEPPAATTPPEQFTPPPPPPAEPAAPTPGPAPWSSDLESRFQDEAVRTQVDAYLRETWQPRVTKLEQETAPARALYQSFQEDPDVALVQAATELYWDTNPDAVRALAKSLKVEFEGDDDGDGEPRVEQKTDDPPPMDPRVAEIIEEREAAKRQQEWDDAMKTIREQQPNLIDDLYLPLVVGAEGDMQAALEAYRERFAKYEQRGEAPAAEETAPPPPNVLGSDGGGAGAPPPVQKEYRGWGGLDEALNDWLASERQPAPPAVGSA